jgi:hypothetical protein
LQVYFDYLNSIDVAYYAAINRSKGLTKEIILPLGDHISVNLAFTVQEFDALKEMIRRYLSGNLPARKSFVGTKEFYPLNLN